jgi:hypothetical protein
MGAIRRRAVLIAPAVALFPRPSLAFLLRRGGGSATITILTADDGVSALTANDGTTLLSSG